jgi:hypothetical protein
VPFFLEVGLIVAATGSAVHTRSQFNTARDVVLQVFPELQGRPVNARVASDNYLPLGQSWDWFPSLSLAVSETQHERGAGETTNKVLVVAS